MLENRTIFEIISDGDYALVNPSARQTTTVGEMLLHAKEVEGNEK